MAACIARYEFASQVSAFQTQMVGLVLWVLDMSNLQSVEMWL